MEIRAVLYLLLLTSCNYQPTGQQVEQPPKDSPAFIATSKRTVSQETKPVVDVGSTTPAELLAFAKSLVGTPYRYASADPVNGFDCSGFITYVFNHFNISVPRSSIDFTDFGTKVDLVDSKPGDLILFTGTDSTVREVGHMGIITDAGNKEIAFIHSTSGKANGVTITTLNEYYQGRFVKVIRVF